MPGFKFTRVRVDGASVKLVTDEEFFYDKFHLLIVRVYAQQVFDDKVVNIFVINMNQFCI